MTITIIPVTKYLFFPPVVSGLVFFLDIYELIFLELF